MIENLCSDVQDLELKGLVFSLIRLQYHWCREVVTSTKGWKTSQAPCMKNFESNMEGKLVPEAFVARFLICDHALKSRCQHI